MFNIIHQNRSTVIHITSSLEIREIDRLIPTGKTF